MSARDARLKVAVVMSRFPKLTETFVLEEVRALERAGVTVVLYPLLREREPVVHPNAVPWVARARYLPFLSWSILCSQLWYLRHHPSRYLRMVGAVLRGTWGSRNFFVGALGILPKVVHASRLMQREGVTFVQCHFANHPALAGFIVHRLTGIPYSFTAHGADLHRLRHMLPQKAQEAAVVVAISEDNRDLIAAECGPEVRSKLHVVGCGVDTTVFTPVPRSEPRSGPFRVVVVGTLHEVKGQRYLLDACARVMASGIGVHCDVVGDGPDRSNLEAQARATGIGGAVRFRGGLPAPEVRAALHEADVLVAPSVPDRDGRREGIPVVLMEAMACGLPVVSSRLSGIPELIDDGVEGILVEPGDVEGIAAALKRLAADPALRQRMGRSGRARVERDHDVDINASVLARLFRGGSRMIWELGFWGSVTVLGYGLAGFPLLVAARSWRRPTEAISLPTEPDWPTVSVIIAARNEVGCIVETIEQLLASDYPGDRMQVVVASDGSDDGTAEAARAMGRAEVLVLPLPRLGKAAALNAAFRRATGDVLVFTDANSRFTDGALRALMRPLFDPAVGGVAGDQRYASGAAAEGVTGGERVYWSFDRALKQAESRGGSTVSATGAIYAIRRELAEEVPADVSDDFFLSTGVVAAGRRLVFAPDAVAFEAVAGSASLEFARKVRIMTQGLNGVRRRAGLLDPRRSGFYALQLFSHKVLRRLLAVPVLASMVCAVPLSRRRRLYRAVLAGQLAFITAGGLGLLLRERRVGRWLGLSLPAYACMVNAAALRAGWNLVCRRSITQWEPPRR